MRTSLKAINQTNTTLRAVRSGGVFQVEDGKKELVISFTATHTITQSIDRQIKIIASGGFNPI